jgi:hypothetical protein
MGEKSKRCSPLSRVSTGTESGGTDWLEKYLLVEWRLPCGQLGRMHATTSMQFASGCIPRLPHSSNYILRGRFTATDDRILSELFDTSDFPLGWRCGIWDDAHGWLHLLSDLAIFGAYTAIPLVIAYFVIREEQDIPFPRIMWLFVIFIFACRTTHLTKQSSSGSQCIGSP